MPFGTSEDDPDFQMALIFVVCVALLGIGITVQHYFDNEARLLNPYRKQWQGAPYKGRFNFSSPENQDKSALPREGQVTLANQYGLVRAGVFSAMGTDQKMHPANAFLIKFLPFKTDQLWIVMRLVAERLKYAYDTDFFPDGYKDVWQTSKQAYRFMRGDCEDHAILIADWLIEMGYDARVAVGKMRGGGHAWVVLFENDQVYLIEATSKFSHKQLPLAKFRAEYHPLLMFNQDTTWFNYGTSLTTNYRSSNWRPLFYFKGAA